MNHSISRRTFTRLAFLPLAAFALPLSQSFGEEPAPEAPAAPRFWCEFLPGDQKGVRLMKDGQPVWEFHLDGPERKPFIAPLCLPDGRNIANLRPKDHVWHLGVWFSWKYLNGVNYWEPNQGGETLVKHADIQIDGASAKAEIQMIYCDSKAPEETVLSEKRNVIFGAPDESGTYEIEFRHAFTAGSKDVVLDRTPPHPKGGGYAGLGIRLTNETSQMTVRCENGETEMLKIREKPASWIEYRDEKTGNGLKVTVLEGPADGCFYAQSSPNYCFINPCPVMHHTLTIPAGETLKLAYRIRVGK